MATISSNADIVLNNQSLSADEVQSKQAPQGLTKRAASDVKQVDVQTQRQENLQQVREKAQRSQQQEESKQLEREQLESMAQQLQDFMGGMNRSLQFKVDEDSGRDVIKVLDKHSGDLIKQYPSEEVLSLVSKLSKTAGILIDQKV